MCPVLNVGRIMDSSRLKKMFCEEIPVSNATVVKDCNNSISGSSGSEFTELFAFIYSNDSMPVDVRGPFPSKISNIGLQIIDKLN